MALASMTRYDKIWRKKKITVNTKVRLLKAVITSIALYGCQSSGLFVRRFPPGRLIAHVDKTARAVAPIKYSFVDALCTAWQ